MEKKEVLERFFDGNEELADKVALTNDEIRRFKELEHKMLVANGLNLSNGHYSIITVEEISLSLEDETSHILYCRMICGIEEDGSGCCRNAWSSRYNRKSKKFTN